MIMVTNRGGQEVVHLDGSKINWKNPPRANDRVKWTQSTVSGRIVQGSLRHIAHLNRLNNLSKKKFGVGIKIFQSAYNTGVAASAGTHDFDATVDLYIPGVAWFTAQRFLRANGFGCWYRREPAFPNNRHIHGFTLPPREGRDPSDDFRSNHQVVGVFVDGGWSRYGRRTTSSQIEDYYAGRDGLASHRIDSSWRPNPQPIFNLSAYIRTRAA